MEPALKIPGGLLEALRRRGLDIEPIAFTWADMTNDGELRKTYLLLSAEELIFAVSSRSEEMAFAGAARRQKEVRAEDIGELHRYPLASLTDPKLLNQVVGGLFALTIDGEETWLCRFTSARMRDVRRFTDRLVRQLKREDESLPPLSEEEEDEEFCPKCGMPYPERGRPFCPKCMKGHTVFVRVLSFFKEYKGRVAVMLLCVALSGAFNAVWPFFSGALMYDKVLAKNEAFAASLGLGTNFVLLLGLLMLVLLGIRISQQVTGIIHGRMTAHMVPGVVCKLKNSVFAALQKLSIGFFTRRQTGSLMQRVNNDANEVLGFFIDGLPYLLFNVITLAISIAVMFMMEWRLALAAIVMLPPLVVISYYLLPRFWHANGRRARVTRSMYSILNDNLTGARVVRAFGKEKDENKRFEKSNERVRDAELDVVRYQNRFDAAYSAARDLPNVLICSLGAVLILFSNGEFTYGQLIAFTAYLGMLQGPMDFFAHVFGWWSGSMNAAQRIFEIVDANPEIVEKENAVDCRLRGDIELRHVTFSYEPNKPVLQDISFAVKAGEMLGIVGRSGAGKSTLVNLISRLYDADSGEVLLDGLNVKDLAFSSLRGSVAMVSQETYVFMGTVAENIAYAPSRRHAG